jgi:hypothetical protein
MSIVIAPAKATQNETAVALLKAAFECPVPSYRNDKRNMVRETLERDQYVGDAVRFKLFSRQRNIVQDYDNPPSTFTEDVTWEANFSDLGKVNTFRLDLPPMVKMTIFCSETRDCFAGTSKAGGDAQQLGPTSVFVFYACDMQTADNIVAAINVLRSPQQAVTVPAPALPASTPPDRTPPSFVYPSTTGRVVWTDDKFISRENRDLDGDDIRPYLRDVTQRACISACSANPDCQGYSFDEWNNFCILKSKVSASRLEPRSISGVNKFFYPSFPNAVSTAATMFPYPRKYFPGERSKTMRVVSGAACSATCLADLSCVAFTFNQADRKCHMFKSTGQYFAADDGVESGVKMQAK